LTATQAEFIGTWKLHEVAMIAAQHFAAELRRKDGRHTQTAPFLRFVWKDGAEI
jgi:hypothetical protein